MDKLELTLHSEKTKLVDMYFGKDSFDFLGFNNRFQRFRNKSWKWYWTLQQVPSKKDTTFSTTVSRSMFGDALPKIVIVENGIKKTTEDSRMSIWSIRDRVFPALYPRFIGQEGFDGETYRIKGEVMAEEKEVKSAVKYTQIRLVIKVQDKLILDEIIPSGTLYSSYEVNESISLSREETCIMKVVATDSMGFEHHYTVGYWGPDVESQRKSGFAEEHIYSSDGELLWKPDYKEIY